MPSTLKQSKRSYIQAWRKANPEKYKAQQKRSALKRYYGMAVEDWDAMFERQGRRCAICRSDSPHTKRDWHTDRCHETLVVRGILCHPCNMMLGGARDNPETLQRAITYLGN